MGKAPQPTADRETRRAEIERLMEDRHARKDMLAGLFSQYFQVPTTFRCELDDHVVHLNPRDRTITPAILAKGHWNRDELEQAVTVLQRHGALRDGGLFVDVGANIGTQSIYAMKTGAFAGVHAFEPAPDNVALFRKNMEENAFVDRVRLVEAGVSDAAGTATLHFHPHNYGGHSLEAGSLRRDAGSREIDVTTLDAALAQAGVTPADIGLVWIDVEGHEAAVVAGAASLIAARVPIVFEFLAINRDHPSTPAMLATLASCYDRVYRLQDETFAVHDMSELDKRMAEGDYLVFADAN